MTDSEQEERLRTVERIDRALAWRYGSLDDDVSWATLAKLNRWSTTTMHEIRRGQRPIKLVEGHRIARRLEFRGGWLFFGEPPKRDDADHVGGDVPELPSIPVGGSRAKLDAKPSRGHEAG